MYIWLIGMLLAGVALFLVGIWLRNEEIKYYHNYHENPPFKGFGVLIAAGGIFGMLVLGFRFMNELLSHL